MVKLSRIVSLLIADALCINLAYIFVFLLRFEFDVESQTFMLFFAVYTDNLVIITLIELVILWLFGLYNSLWRYAGSEEMIQIILAGVVSTAAMIVYLELTQQYFPRSIYILSCIFTIMFIGGIRFAYRFIRNLRHPGAFNNFVLRIGRRDLLNPDITKVMVVGAGDAGATIIKEIKIHGEFGKKVVVAIDDNPAKRGKRIAGVKIAGGRKEIRSIVRKYHVDEIIIAMPSASKKTIQEVINECNRTRCNLKTLPALIDLINEKVSISKLRDVDIEDLLGREPVQINLREISGYIEGKIVLVTGGGGSIGSELCRQIAKFKPRKLIAFDIYENSVFELMNELKTKYPLLQSEAAIGSVRSKRRMNEVFTKYHPHVVFHAAAHKHVPLMEMNPKEALINNVLGTKNIIDLAEDYAVEKFVMISTDKAVNPTNVMGATKRVAEMILQNKSRTSRTRFSAVRFGNVLGSNGSVIPIFRKQIEQGGPVTVTHEEITRYFMTIPEAVQLVIQTGAMAEGGEIFILDMGEPVRIMDLAENVIRLSGYVPYVDIDIKITGLRPGEKLYEELLLDEEGIEKTRHDKIYVGHPIPATDELSFLLTGRGADGQSGKTVEEKISELMYLPEAETREWLHRVVPTFNEKSARRNPPYKSDDAKVYDTGKFHREISSQKITI